MRFGTETDSVHVKCQFLVILYVLSFYKLLSFKYESCGVLAYLAQYNNFLNTITDSRVKHCVVFGFCSTFEFVVATGPAQFIACRRNLRDKVCICSYCKHFIITEQTLYLFHPMIEWTKPLCDCLGNLFHAYRLFNDPFLHPVHGIFISLHCHNFEGCSV